MSRSLQMLLSVLAALTLATTPGVSGQSLGRKPPCSRDLGTVSTDGRIVAADLPSRSAPRLAFGKATRRVQPPYPQGARLDCAVGRVVVLATVSELGVVTAADVRFGSHPSLDEAALQAAKGWLFTPTTADDVAVPAFAQLIFDFSAY